MAGDNFNNNSSLTSYEGEAASFCMDVASLLGDNGLPWETFGEESIDVICETTFSVVGSYAGDES